MPADMNFTTNLVWPAALNELPGTSVPGTGKMHHPSDMNFTSIHVQKLIQSCFQFHPSIHPHQLPAILTVFASWITSVPAQAMPSEISRAGGVMGAIDSASRTGCTR